MVDVNNRLMGATATLVGKKPCRAASTGNLFLSGYQNIDGTNFDVTAESAGANMRVLVNQQADPRQNGIYLVNSGLWSREKDFDGNNDFVKGTPIPITDGTLYRKTMWAVTSSDPANVGINPITVAPLSVRVPFTLNANSTQTTIPIPYASTASSLAGQPAAVTPNAAAFSPTLYCAFGSGQLVANHAANPSTDLTFTFKVDI